MKDLEMVQKISTLVSILDIIYLTSKFMEKHPMSRSFLRKKIRQIWYLYNVSKVELPVDTLTSDVYFSNSVLRNIGEIKEEIINLINNSSSSTDSSISSNINR